MTTTDVTMTTHLSTAQAAITPPQDRQFLFRCVKPFNHNMTQEVIPVPLIQTDSAQEVLFRFTGKHREIVFTFILFNDGTDVSGTSGLGIFTVAQQIQYLMGLFFEKSYDTQWSMAQPANINGTINGVVDSIKIEHQNPTFAVGTLSFKEGYLGPW